MTRNQDLLVLSGNAHPDLAESIAKNLQIGLVNATIDQFPDGETHVEIIDDVRDQDVFVIQPTGTTGPQANHNLMESLIVVETLKRASAGRITVVAPYYGYARQDRKEKSRVPITAKLVTKLFETAGANRLLAVDLHSHQTQGFAEIPFDHLYAARTITEDIRDEIDSPVVVAPDVGAGKMARGYAGRLETEWAMIDKDRKDPYTTQVLALIGHSVVGRNVLLVDDIVSTGGSILKAADFLKDQGAEQVFAAATHGVLCGDALERVEASQSLDRLYVTDTLPVPDSSKIRHITIAPLLARAISNIHEGRSVSELF